MEQRRYEAVIFDLDGTLLDTLQDLTDSINTVLSGYGMPQYTAEQVRGFLGNGIRRLLQQTVPQGEKNPVFEEVYESFRIYYGEHCMDATEPYPGIMSLLDALKKQGIHTAIVSNKADFAVKKLSTVYFGDLIASAVGERSDCRRKPAPDSVLHALRELGKVPERAVYVGDSEVDLLTADHAGMDCIIVSWGFRDRRELLQAGVKEEWIASNVRELRQLLL